jgi:hypothetical protein
MPPGGVLPPDGIFMAGRFYLALMSEIYYKQPRGFSAGSHRTIIVGPTLLFPRQRRRK